MAKFVFDFFGLFNPKNALEIYYELKSHYSG